jgi:hypothetical protein
MNDISSGLEILGDLLLPEDSPYAPAPYDIIVLEHRLLYVSHRHVRIDEQD